MKVLLTGSEGQLGRELARRVPEGLILTALSHAELDIGDEPAVRAAGTALASDVIVNAAGYTDVDRAESERADAYRVNADGTEHLARIAKRTGARLIHVSTDYVFDGRQSHPYRPDDAPNPVNVYGASKLAGEQRASNVLGDRCLIVRTAWLYAAQGRNFVNGMLTRMRRGEPLRVVADQVGTPTWAESLAQLIWRAVARDRDGGCLHWTDAGVASWYDFAVAIGEEASAASLLERPVPIEPISSAERGSPARRPAYSVLDSTSARQRFALVPEHWRVALRQMLQAGHG